MSNRSREKRLVKVSGGKRFGTIRLNDPLKSEARRISAENTLFNSCRPRSEHRTTSVRKIRKQLRRFRNAQTINRTAA